MTDALRGIYFKRDYSREGSTVTLTIQAENINLTARISEECLLIAIKNDLGLEVGE